MKVTGTHSLGTLAILWNICKRTKLTGV